MKMRLGFLFSLLLLAAFASAQSVAPAAPIAPDPELRKRSLGQFNGQSPHRPQCRIRR